MDSAHMDAIEKLAGFMEAPLKTIDGQTVVIDFSTTGRRSLARGFVAQVGEVAKIDRALRDHTYALEGWKVLQKKRQTHFMLMHLLETEWASRITQGAPLDDGPLPPLGSIPF